MRKRIGAALALCALLLCSPSGAQEPPREATREEIARLIADLGGDSADAQLDARKRLRALGAAALPALQRAIYHENPDVRVEAQALARLVRADVEVQAALAPVRRGVAAIRERWKARDFDDLEAVAREAFAPMRPRIVRYVPRKETGGRFVVGAREGDPDLLTPALEQALSAGEGIVCVEPGGNIRPSSNLILFTLPDRKGWSAYLVVQVAGALPAAPENFKSRLLAHTENRQVWGLDPDEIAWLDANKESVLDRDLQAVPHAGGGLRIERVAPGSLLAARGLQAGDLLRDLNGTPLNNAGDVREILRSPTLRQQSGIRITIERGGRPVVLEYRPLPR